MKNEKQQKLPLVNWKRQKRALEFTMSDMALHLYRVTLLTVEH